MRDGYGAAVCEEPEDIYKRKSDNSDAEESSLIVKDYEQLAYTNAARAFLRKREDMVAALELAALRSLEMVAAEEPDSVRRVIEHIKAAPIAYFKFASLTALLCFVFSIVFYLVFHTILINPLFAVYGALGSLLSWLLAAVSKQLTGDK